MTLTKVSRVGDPAPEDASGSSALLRMEGISKRFGRNVALREVNLEVDRGEVHAILGENGAGKSTLMNILYGATTPSEGRILWRGEPVEWRSPREAIRRGIAMVHQQFMLVPALTVAENLDLAPREDRPFCFDRKGAKARVRELAARFGFELDPDARVDSLPVGARQRLEILKALRRRAELLILDEPTAVLTPRESLELRGFLRALAQDGTAILFISHKLGEVLEFADRMSVLRRGSLVGSFLQGDVDARSLAQAILGNDRNIGSDRNISPEMGAPGERPRRPHPVPPEFTDEKQMVLELRGAGSAATSERTVRHLQLQVRAGEIFGVTGVDGNGQEELAALVAGVLPCAEGSVFLAGADVTRLDAGARRRLGLGVLPPDRHREGLIAEFRLWENVALVAGEVAAAPRFGPPPELARRESVGTFPGTFLLHPGRHRRRVTEMITNYDIRGGDADSPTHALSGGNQQKLLLSRELELQPRVLLVVNPTRGLDLGASAAVRQRILQLRDEGMGILFVSTDLDEILEIADRAGVMVDGTFREVPNFDRETLGLAMLTRPT